MKKYNGKSLLGSLIYFPHHENKESCYEQKPHLKRKEKKSALLVYMWLIASSHYTNSNAIDKIFLPPYWLLFKTI